MDKGEKPNSTTALDYVKGFYDALDAQANTNKDSARHVVTFSSGFLGIVGVGAYYVVSQHPEWCDLQRLCFIMVSGMAFISFFISVLLSFIYIRAHRKIVYFPTLPKEIVLSSVITSESVRDFEQARYDVYKDLVKKGPKVALLYTWAFVLMLAGFVFYGLAAGLLIVFSLGVC